MDRGKQAEVAQTSAHYRDVPVKFKHENPEMLCVEFERLLDFVQEATGWGYGHTFYGIPSFVQKGEAILKRYNRGGDNEDRVG